MKNRSLFSFVAVIALGLATSLRADTPGMATVGNARFTVITPTLSG